MLLKVLRRGYLILFFKTLAKIGRAFEAYLVSYLGNRMTGL